MSKDIRITKGLDIKLVGEAKKSTTKTSLSSTYAIKPDDFHGITPKLLVKEGAEVKAGQALFYSKSDERILVPSPVSGKVVEIKRGARRKVLAVKIAANAKNEHTDFGVKKPSDMSAQEIKEHLFLSGCWPFIKQRPFDVVANPNQTPKAIFISGYATAPLAADLSYTLNGKELEINTAIEAIAKLTEGKVHLSVGKEEAIFNGIKNVEKHNVSGPHPAGNVSTQIARIDPINKGEVVWIVKPADLVVMGELFLTGRLNLTRTIALTGSQFENPQYVTAISGASIADVVKNNLNNDNTRIISGDVLTGNQVNEDGFLGYYDNQVTAIPEGDDYEFFGWNKPVFDKISPSRALTFSWLNPKKKYDLNTNTNGEHRAFVVTGSYENVFPLDIYPMQLLKAFMYKDLDEMEALGGYEVAPEDFALTEFICVSKQPHQKIIREGLDLMREELG
ncbi:Na(+)-translocating NADH-quinone reductase subunit A [Polaribacter porphyrae]|uniref:Na(+)-translocating NADH-quinone reductase subunit A n=1 Tax=Polaribacter porphyrae TaxID=1137780 RepID=A0A2S7WP50_9FLAO|nr:Na(+)-translocating NADH-quinone reductase subunit A [Polaribacter porphyrae]PQJ79363.1 NADH:ubiquinone reductase (Na(+)-transporting) subunit A [Polaribacter porphyrae]